MRLTILYRCLHGACATFFGAQIAIKSEVEMEEAHVRRLLNELANCFGYEQVKKWLAEEGT